MTFYMFQLFCNLYISVMEMHLITKVKEPKPINLDLHHRANKIYCCYAFILYYLNLNKCQMGQLKILLIAESKQEKMLIYVLLFRSDQHSGRIFTNLFCCQIREQWQPCYRNPFESLSSSKELLQVAFVCQMVGRQEAPSVEKFLPELTVHQRLLHCNSFVFFLTLGLHEEHGSIILNSGNSSTCYHVAWSVRQSDSRHEETGGCIIL